MSDRTRISRGLVTVVVLVVIKPAAVITAIWESSSLKVTPLAIWSVRCSGKVPASSSQVVLETKVALLQAIKVLEVVVHLQEISIEVAVVPLFRVDIQWMMPMCMDTLVRAATLLDSNKVISSTCMMDSQLFISRQVPYTTFIFILKLTLA